MSMEAPEMEEAPETPEMRSMDIKLSLLLAEIWKMPPEPGVDQLTWAIFWDAIRVVHGCIGHIVAANKQAAWGIIGRTTDPGEFAQAQYRCEEVRRVAGQWMKSEQWTKSGYDEFDWLTTSLSRLIASQR